MQQRRPHILQHIHNLLEPQPGRQIMDEGEAAVTHDSPEARTRYLIRVTHSSGMLEGKYTAETTFPPTDHRSHRPKSWLINGLKKIETLKFLVGPDRTLGQAALQWLLADPRVASCLPNIYDEEQLKEFAAAPDCPPLTPTTWRAHRGTGARPISASRAKCRTTRARWTRETAAA